MKWGGSSVELYYIQPWFVTSICCVSHASLLLSQTGLLSSKSFMVHQLHWLLLTPSWTIDWISSRRLGMAHTCLGMFKMAPQMLWSLNLRAQLKASCQAVLLFGTVAAKHWTARTCGGWCGQLHITSRVYRSNLQDIYTRWNRKIIGSTLINNLFSVLPGVIIYFLAKTIVPSLFTYYTAA